MNDIKPQQFIKYPGNKTKLMPVLRQYLPAPCDCEYMVDMFTGSGSLLMNTHYKRYIMADANKDLIWLFDTVRRYPENVIIQARYFYKKFNNRSGFEELRRSFPLMKKGIEQSAVFIYLIYHCFNGVVRYNQKGEFNTPYGVEGCTPYFPEREVYAFSERINAVNVQLVHGCWRKTLREVEGMRGVGFYCDPPYLPKKGTEGFTTYSGTSFTESEHILLAYHLGRIHRQYGYHVVVSSSDNTRTRDIYRDFTLHTTEVHRAVAANGVMRGKTSELIGVLDIK
ncbi:DNA adenine methylase [Yersinia enterocolitica]|uniref:DNA adenine methylase n=1 Tax=Yersinia enterocolitica TaxID=630 RepID=UPI001C8D17A6|nr:Dam family site-specific DNA-(adenine-N6)-methyltransferase [Yersinia enterocolitica]MBX9476794.1 Dam family site-specific DNA-(adenine-N6)-methyltransferase [Yersinia enterocolitica]